MSDIVERLSFKSDTDSRDAMLEIERLRAERDAARLDATDFCERLLNVGQEAKKQAERATAAEAELAKAREALREIASYDDKGANERLEKTGSYSAFDEPGAVQIARAALAEQETEDI